ncbi:uncharacterized protein misp3.L [Xenopus laevis]|nr:uncharacterized protein misp3.L [Xenopus laevis]
MASEQLVSLDSCPAPIDNQPHDQGTAASSPLIEISGVTQEQSSQCLLLTEHTGAPVSQSAPVTEQEKAVGPGGVKEQDTPAEGHVGGTGQGAGSVVQVAGEGADTEGRGDGRGTSGHMAEGGTGEMIQLKQEEGDTWVQGTNDFMVRDGEAGPPVQLINLQAGVPELLIQLEGPEAEELVHTTQVTGEERPGVPELLIQIQTEGSEEEELVHTPQVTGEEGPGVPELLIQLHTEGPEEEEGVQTPQVTGEEGPGVPELLIQVKTEGPEAEGAVQTPQVTGEEGTDGKASDSSEEAEKEVTPNPCAGPCWEGTVEPECPAACWERECTGREVKTDPTEQGDTQTGTVTERTAAMKEREIQTEGDANIFETPIEREIRLAMEREQMLRQERGISAPVGQPELVEVRRKVTVGEQLAGVGKERQLAGAQMLRDIQQETRREQDLVDQGKVMGAYDRGQQQEVLEKKMMFESMVIESSDSPLKKRQSGSQEFLEPEFAEFVVLGIPPEASNLEVKKGLSFAEANGSNIILIEHSSLLRRPASISPLDSPPVVPTPPSSVRAESPIPAAGSPYLMINSPSSGSLLEREIEEVKQREKELRRQRSSIYGKEALEISVKEQENREDIQSGIYQPERTSWRKLEVNWPPNREESMNGVASEEVKESPRLRRQRSLLIQSWESGNPTPRDEQ